MSRPRKDLTGQKFGKLTVIKDMGNSMFLCQCECGKEVVVFRSNLQSGRTQSCGCIRNDLSSERLKELWSKR